MSYFRFCPIFECLDFQKRDATVLWGLGPSPIFREGIKPVLAFQLNAIPPPGIQRVDARGFRIETHAGLLHKCSRKRVVPNLVVRIGKNAILPFIGMARSIYLNFCRGILIVKQWKLSCPGYFETFFLGAGTSEDSGTFETTVPESVSLAKVFRKFSESRRNSNSSKLGWHLQYRDRTFQNLLHRTPGRP